MSQNINTVKETLRTIRARTSRDNTVKADQATSGDTAVSAVAADE